MRFFELQVVALAHLAISVNGLAVAEHGSSSLHSRATPVASPVASSSPSPSPTGDTQEAPECTGYLSHSPSEWQARLGHQFDDNLPERTCLVEYLGSGKGTDIIYI
ncbi:hypothetical protein N7449_000435 [Penicillium cf. viridicatum]|uniref:Uncharacterized protein n=1 Tax=Penicillium cf. viridicatum TaxID=2972119 RepID=A0A9W9N4Y2_9EURO|nr:hypothetical protein N7449_000435 [Penicillium cf. viridicatum]